MDAGFYINHREQVAYDMLLTLLVQYGLADVWGPCRSVPDPDRVVSDVVAHAAIFGNELIQCLVRDLQEYIDPVRFSTRLEPLMSAGDPPTGELHITAQTEGISGQMDQMPQVLIWDAGHGSRMGSLLEGGKSKGNLEVFPGRKLYHYSAGIAKWLVGTLREIGKDYVAFISADQVVYLSPGLQAEVRTILYEASRQDADMIFFDAPGALSLTRLRYFIGPATNTKGWISLVRDMRLLELFGGAHILQCVLLRRDRILQLATALDIILKVQRMGSNIDVGVYDIAVLPRLAYPRLVVPSTSIALKPVYSALTQLASEIGRIFPICGSIGASYNVNSPAVLAGLKRRIM